MTSDYVPPYSHAIAAAREMGIFHEVLLAKERTLFQGLLFVD